MKITKTANEAITEMMKRQTANQGCNICPCCGETMDILEAIKNGYALKRGIISHIVEVPKKNRWFSQKYELVEKYHCNKCGAEWESDPY